MFSPFPVASYHFIYKAASSLIPHVSLTNAIYKIIFVWTIGYLLKGNISMKMLVWVHLFLERQSNTHLSLIYIYIFLTFTSLSFHSRCFVEPYIILKIFYLRHSTEKLASITFSSQLQCPWNTSNVPENLHPSMFQYLSQNLVIMSEKYVTILKGTNS